MPTDQLGARLRITDLTKRFRGADVPAVDRVGLDIAPGEFMTFLGPSGSGKTTTLNMIAGLETVTSGTITMDDRDIATLPPYKRDLGMVFQQYALFPHMTAAKNIAFPLRQRRTPKAEIAGKVAEALRLVRLEEYAERLPAQLSGGQQQRVALARAIVFGPRALLMDEPLGALDKKLREQLQVEIGRLHRELGATVVFVTHDQEEALALSDRIAIFNQGRIEQVGAPDDLYERPATRFVATFVGDSNIFDGTLSGGTLTGDGYTLRVPDAGAHSGGPAALVVRPERLRVVDEPRPDGNTLSGTVTDVVYQGAYRKILLEFDAGVPGTVREPVGDAGRVRPGDRVHAAWDADAGSLVTGSHAGHGTATARDDAGTAAMMDGAADAAR